MSDLAALRAHLDWSQVDLAAYLGRHQATVARLEAGGPMDGAVDRLVKRLRVLVDLGHVSPGMPVAEVLAIAIGDPVPDRLPSPEPECA